MSESKSTSVTNLRAFVCPEEGRINRAAELSAGLRADLRIIRSAVASGTFTPEYGVRTMKLEGGLSPTQELQLTSCLGKIAADACPNYPLNKVAE